MEKLGLTIRKFDDLGRVVIPIEMRRELKIETHDRVEIFRYKDGIFIKKQNPQAQCALCGSGEDLVDLEGRNSVCRKCIENIKK